MSPCKYCSETHYETMDRIECLEAQLAKKCLPCVLHGTEGKKLFAYVADNWEIGKTPIYKVILIKADTIEDAGKKYFEKIEPERIVDMERDINADRKAEGESPLDREAIVKGEIQCIIDGNEYEQLVEVKEVV